MKQKQSVKHRNAELISTCDTHVIYAYLRGCTFSTDMSHVSTLTICGKEAAKEKEKEKEEEIVLLCLGVKCTVCGYMHVFASICPFSVCVYLGLPFCDRVLYSFSSSNDPQLAFTHWSQAASPT